MVVDEPASPRGGRSRGGTRRAATVLVAATALLFLFPAQARAEVQVRGKLYPEFARIRLGEARPPDQPAGTLSAPGGEGAAMAATNLLSSNSYIAFLGRESLGPREEAFWRYERGVNLGTGEATPRDAFVGLRSGAVTVRVGLMDTVYKDLGDRLRFFGLSSGNFVSSSTILSKPAIGDSSAASFHLRRADSIRIDTDESARLSAHLQYSPDESGSTSRNADLLSVGAVYRDGPWYVSLAHERHRDFFGGSRSSPAVFRNDRDPEASSDDWGTRLAVVYRLSKSVRVEANYAWLRYREKSSVAGRFASLRDDAWKVATEYRSGDWRAQVSLVGGAVGSCTLQQGAPCDVTGQDGWMLNVGLGRALSRRTLLFALAGWLENGAGASYNPTENFDVLGGQSVRHFAAGILHVF